ncbi:MAG: hypothetical protein IPO41_09740 [Acidobacteria bacterium]|nr:hypothetical protein [Acidobacteriota bacterium]
MMKYLVVLSIHVVMFVGCQSASTKNTVAGVPNAAAEIKEGSPREVQQAVSKAYSQFIDVRTPEEYATGHAARAENIPLDTLAASFDKLEKNEPVYIICETGNRSNQAASILKDAGFKSLVNVSGGTVAWKAAGLPIETGSPHIPASSSGKLDPRTQEALLSALADERLAQATYQAVLNRFPGARPFINIIEAEKNHESFLLPLFAKYGVAVPRNENDPAKIDVPADLTEACRVGVKAENENIALYDRFLAFVKEPDIKEVFTRLQSASRENHLPAFTRCSEGGMGGGRGKGRPV